MKMITLPTLSIVGDVKISIIESLFRRNLINETDHSLSLARNIVRHSALFDAKWYLAQHPDVAASGRDPADHYCFVGWKRGFNPGPSFDGNAYLAANPDVKEAKKNPLVHHIQFGIRGNRPLNPMQKPATPSVPGAATSAKVSDAEALRRDIAVVSKSELFDGAWYLKHYPDVAKAKMDPVRHYCKSGWREERRPGPNFDGKAYLAANPDVQKGGMNPLVHYIQFGIKEKTAAQPMQKPVAVRRSSWLGRLFAYRPKISVIVASYNYEQYIGETLDGVLNQTYGNYEVIVIDDGSKDHSVDVIRKYAAKSSKIKFFQHAGGVNRGLPATVKLGVEKSTGDYIAFCESDDIWEPANLERKVDLIRQSKRKAKIVINDISTFGDPDRCKHLDEIIRDRMKRMDKFANFITPEEFRDKNYICTFSCVMVERKLLRSCDFLSTPRPSNLDWWLWRQLCYVTPIHVVREKLTRWRCHQSYMVRESIDDIVRRYDFHKKLNDLLYDAHPDVKNAISEKVIKCRSVSYDGRRFKVNGQENPVQPTFSLVAVARHDLKSIVGIIECAKQQTYSNWDLVIVCDDVKAFEDAFPQSHFPKSGQNQIQLYNASTADESEAYNFGVKHAKNEWVVYLDCSVTLSKYHLETFAREILLNPEQSAFYCQMMDTRRKSIRGQEFDLDKLLSFDTIALSTFVHRRSLVDAWGGFDSAMRSYSGRDLIVRYSKKKEPTFIERILVFSDVNAVVQKVDVGTRFSDLNLFRRKNCNYPIVTTVVTTYNHEPYLRMALDNAICQQGRFIHEILVSDDCSTDGTRSIVREYAQKYPGLIVDISSDHNLGISENMRKCFSMAHGEVLAMLEGDDYWTSPFKLRKQLEFLQSNTDCSMVFSRPKVKENNAYRLLTRHDGLPAKLSGCDLFKAESISLLVNFSCCMFRTRLLQELPEKIYEKRLSEIALSFYLERFGKIGYISEPLSTYRIHSGGTFSGSTYVQKRNQERFCREISMDVCAAEFKEPLSRLIALIDEDIVRFKAIERIRTNPSDEIEKRMFSAEWYVYSYPEVMKTGILPFDHYMKVGWKEGKDPAATFSTNEYLSLNPAVVKSGMCPLHHYVKFGCKEGRRFSVRRNVPFLYDAPSQVFDYRVGARRQYSISLILPKGLNLNMGERTFFSELQPGASVADLIEAVRGIKSEYVTFMLPNDCWSSGRLDRIEKFINLYGHPELIVNDLSPMGDRDVCNRVEKEILVPARNVLNSNQNHIASSVLSRGRIVPTLSCVTIKVSAFLKCDFANAENYEDCCFELCKQLADKNVSLYFLPEQLTRWGVNLQTVAKRLPKSAGRDDASPSSGTLTSSQVGAASDENIALIKSSPYFDGQWYLSRHEDVAGGNLDPAAHYLSVGWRLGYDPGPKFGTIEYLDSYPDIKRKRMCPLLHYMRVGMKEGRNRACFSFGAPIVLPALEGRKRNPLGNLWKSVTKNNAPEHRILMVSHELTYTGAPLSLLRAARAFVDLGYHVNVISLKEGPLHREFEQLKACRCLSPAKEDFVATLSETCDDCDFAIINTLVPCRLYWMLSRIMPTVWWVREPPSVVAKDRLMRLVIRNATGLYTMSPMSREEFLPYNSNINIIKHGLDDHYRHVAARPEKFRFAVIGAIAPRKGFDVFIRAVLALPAAKCKNVEFLLVGAKYSQSYYDELVALAAGRVTFVGEIADKKEMLLFYQRASCIVVPSREEPTSRVAIEAMMMARPVIMSDKVGAKYLINKKSGWMFKSEDWRELSKIMLSVIDNRRQINRFGRAARMAYLENNAIQVFEKNLELMVQLERKRFKSSRFSIIVLEIDEGSPINEILRWLSIIPFAHDLLVVSSADSDSMAQTLRSELPDASIVVSDRTSRDQTASSLLAKIDASRYAVAIRLPIFTSNDLILATKLVGDKPGSQNALLRAFEDHPEIGLVAVACEAGRQKLSDNCQLNADFYDSYNLATVGGPGFETGRHYAARSWAVNLAAGEKPCVNAEDTNQRIGVLLRRAGCAPMYV